MKQSFRMTRLAALSLAVAAAACNKAPPEKPAAQPAAPAVAPVATVDGAAISRQVYDFYAKNVAQKALSELDADQKNQILDSLVSSQILANFAIKNGLDKDADIAPQLEIQRMRLLADAATQKYLKDKEPTEQEMRVEYENAITSMDKTEYRARHILVATLPLAKELTAKIKAGAKFEEIAKKNSSDTGSAAKGGELPPFTADRMVKPFSDAVKRLKKGEITAEPVQSQFGWHIIQLLGTGEVTPPTFEQAKQQLARAVLQKKLQGYVDELKKTAKIEKSL
jgi:peptidyl-prolyl cis-trans isomerase C